MVISRRRAVPRPGEEVVAGIRSRDDAPARRPKYLGGMGLRVWAQRWGDWVLALALAAVAEFELWAHAPAGLVVTGGRAPLAVLFGFATVPLAWRRRAPLAVLFVVTGALVVVAFLIRHPGGVPLGVFLALIVAFYSVSALCEERRALRVGAGALATIAAVDLTRGGVFEAHGARPAAW